MTKEEKEVLIKDLCGRLPYGVKFAFNQNVYTAKGLDLIVTDEGDWEYAVTAKGIEPIEIGFIKPYLRPMSSMTDEEYNEFKDLTTCGSCCNDYDRWGHWGVEVVSYKYDEWDKPFYDFSEFQNLQNWLNKKHLDYMGLIPMGLALEATEDMYKTK